MSPSSSKDPDGFGTKLLSVALIGPEQRRRNTLAQAIASQHASVDKEFSVYPEIDDVPRLLKEEYDVIIIELDSNPEHAFDLVENICGSNSVTVMVYSALADPETLVRCMRAGAREFLTEPFAEHTIAEALVRASVRRPIDRATKKAGGKLFVFVGSKGGAGVTTIASNFAISLAQESRQSTLLIDLNFPLGDAALGLGIIAQYSTANALQNSNRLDYNFLSKLLMKHSSGVSVLAAPDKYVPVQVSNEAVDRLLNVARQNFDYVVVDAGARFNSLDKAIFGDVSTVYLVTQVGVSELRNCNCLMTELAQSSGIKVEVVLNRFSTHLLGIDEQSITKALTMPAQWKIPSDYETAQNAQNTATPLTLKDSPISRVVRQMARMASGLPPVSEKRKRFGIFG